MSHSDNSEAGIAQTLCIAPLLTVRHGIAHIGEILMAVGAYKLMITLAVEPETVFAFEFKRTDTYLSPIGLKGSKKVTDYLSDIKFENLHKGNVMVLCDATGKIICLPGLQIAGSVKVTTSTTQILQIRVL